MLYKAMLGAVLLAIPGVARADITATYGMADGNTPFLTMEIAANGDIHGALMSGGITFVVHDRHAFTIQKMPDGKTVVSRVEDIATVMTEMIAKLAPEARAQVAQYAKLMTLVPNGTRTINGRTGDAYFMKLPGGTQSDQPWAVISHDPALAPLGTAMVGQFEMSMKLMGGVLPALAMQPMLDVLHKGAPLMIAGMPLLGISNSPIPASEFALPAEPQTLEQVRARMTAGGMKTGG